MVMCGVMRLSVPRFIVDHNGFAGRRNLFAGLDRRHPRPHIGQLSILLRSGGHQLRRCRFPSGFELLQCAVEQRRIGLLFRQVGRQRQANQHVVQRVHILHQAQLRVQGRRRRLCLL